MYVNVCLRLCVLSLVHSTVCCRESGTQPTPTSTHTPAQFKAQYHIDTPCASHARAHVSDHPLCLTHKCVYITHAHTRINTHTHTQTYSVGAEKYPAHTRHTPSFSLFTYHLLHQVERRAIRRPSSWLLPGIRCVSREHPPRRRLALWQCERGREQGRQR